MQQPIEHDIDPDFPHKITVHRIDDHWFFEIGQGEVELQANLYVGETLVHDVDDAWEQVGQ